MIRTISLAAPGAFAALLAVAPIAGADSNKVVVDMGHGLAKHYCTTCHLVEPGQSNPPDHVGGPAFQTVADREGTTKDALNKHLRETRAGRTLVLAMPPMNLSDDEVVKLVAYIMSLKTPQKAAR
jgi:mono/diheme cytochrome c family protein